MADLGTLLLISVLLVNVDCRDPKTVQSWSEERCKELGVYEVRDLWWCCNCNSGSYKFADCIFGKPTTTNCEVCPFDPDDSKNQTYTTDPNNLTECQRSIDESQCTNVRNSQWKIGSRTRSSLCVCLDGYYAAPESLMAYGCNRHSSCEPGFEPAILGNEVANTQCKKCVPGMYSDVSSPTESCKPHSSCQSDERLEHVGTSISDTVCVREEKEYASAEGLEPYVIIILLLIAALLVASVGACLYCKRNGILCCKANAQSVNYEAGRPSKPKTPQGHASSKSQPSLDPLLDKEPEAPPDVDHTETRLSIENEQKLQLENGNLSVAVAVGRPVSNIENRVDNIPSTANNHRESRRSEGICTITQWDIVEYIKKYCNDPEANDKDRRLLTFNGWKDIVKKLQYNSEIGEIFSTSLIECGRITVSLITGHKIIWSWNDFTNAVLKPIIRMFLKEVEISDMEYDYKIAKEIRYQWIQRICTTLGTKLTPNLLLQKVYDNKCFRDALTSAFISNAVEQFKIKEPAEVPLRRESAQASEAETTDPEFANPNP